MIVEEDKLFHDGRCSVL